MIFFRADRIAKYHEKILIMVRMLTTAGRRYQIILAMDIWSDLSFI